MSGLAAPLAIGTTLARTAVEAQADTAQARFAEQQAAASVALARQQEAALRRAAQRDAATLRARFAGAGVAPTGSPIDVLAERAREDELDARMARYQGLEQAASLQMEARLHRAKRTVRLIGAAGAVGSSLIGAHDSGLKPAPASVAKHAQTPIS